VITGKFISIEGSEGAGKSTALTFIRDYFSYFPGEVLYTREPGGTTVAEEIRDVLLKQRNETIESSTELLLMFAARAQHLARVIIPALTHGKWVISDRFVDASYAYQGNGRGVKQEIIAYLEQYIVNVYPDLTLLLDIPVEIGLARALERGGAQDRIEVEQMDFFVRVRDGYLARAAADPERIKVIDASVSVKAVNEQIRFHLDAFRARVST
jgi:dTMP kinase